MSPIVQTAIYSLVTRVTALEGLSFSFQGAWSSTTVYTTNQVVSYTDGGLYIANQAVAAGEDVPTLNGHWSLLMPAGQKGDAGNNGQGFNFTGAWVSGTGDYHPYDLATDPIDNGVYQCTTAVATSTNSPSTDSVNWAIFVPAGQKGDGGQTGQGFNFTGAWIISTGDYSPYDLATDPLNHGVYQCTTAVAGSSLSPSQDSANWAIFVPAGANATTPVNFLVNDTDITDSATFNSTVSAGFVACLAAVGLDTTWAFTYSDPPANGTCYRIFNNSAPNTFNYILVNPAESTTIVTLSGQEAATLVYRTGGWLVLPGLVNPVSCSPS